MIDIDDLMKRMNETGKGETICLNHDECEALLLLLEEREERIAIMSEGKTTNGDKIRMMTDEEIAEQVHYKIGTDFCCLCPASKICHSRKLLSCEDAFLEWLKEGASE